MSARMPVAIDASVVERERGGPSRVVRSDGGPSSFDASIVTRTRALTRHGWYGRATDTSRSRLRRSSDASRNDRFRETGLAERFYARLGPRQRDATRRRLTSGGRYATPSFVHRDALARSRALAATLCASCVLDNWRPPLDAADVAGETAIVDATPTCQEPAVRALAAGFHGFACVVRCAGDVWCWGRNDRGQLGDGTSARRATPVRVQGVTDGSSLSAGFGHACVGAAGGAWCWGENMAGALGNNTRDGSPRAVTVQGLPGPVASVAAGGLHSCVVLATGEVSCWGDASRGQLGDGSRTGRTTPRGVLDLGGPAAAVVAGQFHTCARLRSGEVSCWGQNTFGTLADGTFDDRTTPTTVPLSAPATDLVTTNNHVCAVVEGGAVWCWGYNDEGQLGDGTRTTRARPVQVRGLPGLVRRGATGSLHTCALLGDGSVWCWGANERGQLGDGGSARRLTPVPVQGLGGVAVALAAGDAVTCAGLQDGRVMCWGANDEGQLGDGSLVDQPRPVAVALPR